MKNLSGMKTIEDIIRNNRDFFEDREPSEGHFDRFSVKLEIRCNSRAIQKKYSTLSSKSGSSYTSCYSVIALDLGSFHS